MLISDSLPQMWLIYLGLAAVVLVTGYLAVRALPRFIRWIVVGAVAGMIAVPTGFHVTASVPEDSYGGTAPAIVAFAVSLIQKDGSGMASAFAMLVLGIGAGVAAGLGIWWLGRGREQRRREMARSRQRRASSADEEENDDLHGEGLRAERRDMSAGGATRSRAARDRQEPSL
ncbi:hypothetical protein QD172_15205 [Cobetia sp. 10Alg 146]|uniref:hypothetical protein n=1 Tax=Cobetia sp. 10Alg 146 TaxID=3040019 RepID=UPI002447422F|nr:hypothetical protein [Cobetia sp. 10Alg 146]MDH2292592.1 hypothetical protein [Cobetia sp. 10Alg 146]